MKAAEATIPTHEQIATGRKQTEAELAAARAELDSAAFDAATKPGDTAARKRMSDARQRVDNLSTELEGLSAVERESRRRHAIASLQADRDALAAEQAQTLAAIKATADAQRVVLDKINELGAAWAEFRKLEEAARVAVIRSYGRRQTNSEVFVSFSLSVQARETMLNATGGELDCGWGNGLQSRTPAVIDDTIERAIQSAERIVRNNIAARAEELDQSLAAAA